MPFVRYLPLLGTCREAERVIVVDSPGDLRRILPLIHRRTEMPWPDVSPRRLRRIRPAASATFYRVVTALAIAYATVRRPEALVYTVDAMDDGGRNRWIEGLYQALRGRGTSFLEIAWSASGARALRQWRLRRRLVAYVQAVAPRVLADLTSSGAGGVTQDRDVARQFLHELARNVLEPAARASIRSIRRYESLLRRTRPTGVYLMDDYVHAFELVVACRRRGVPTVALQHGQFSRYTAGLMGYGFDGATHQSYDKYCVWNDFFAQLILRHSRLVPPDSVVVAGSPRGRTPVGGGIWRGAMERESDHIGARSATTRKRRKGTVSDSRPPDDAAPRQHTHEPRAQRAAVAPRALFIAEHHDPSAQHEVDAYIRALDAGDFELWIKAHPSATQRTAVRARVEAGRGLHTVDAPLDELLGRVDVVVASYSSAIFEAILHMKPVVLFSASRFRDPHGLAAAGLAGYASSPEEIVESVRMAARLPRSELIRRRERVWGTGAESNDGGETAVIQMDRLQQARR